MPLSIRRLWRSLLRESTTPMVVCTLVVFHLASNNGLVHEYVPSINQAHALIVSRNSGIARRNGRSVFHNLRERPPHSSQQQSRNNEYVLHIDQQLAGSDDQVDGTTIVDVPTSNSISLITGSFLPRNYLQNSRRGFVTTAIVASSTVINFGLMGFGALSPVWAANMFEDNQTSTLVHPTPRIFEYTDEGSNGTSITVPLKFTGQELLVSYKVDGSVFKAVLDTGSPFLMIPGSCGANTRQKSGCYQNQGTVVPKFTPTIEIFDGFEGEVNWRCARFDFSDVFNTSPETGNSTTVMQEQFRTAREDYKKDVVFGIASEEIMGGPGGVFFGMIRDTDARIRPSFLGQTDVKAFKVDLVSRPRTLTLSNRALIASSQDYIPLTNLLRRRYGDPVGHYTASASSIYVNGFPLVDTTTNTDNKILVIFDTGVTGMVVSRGLFDERYFLARQRREKALFGNVELTFATASAGNVTLSANRPLSTPFDPERTWKKFPKRREGTKNKVHVIVMGLSFLEDRSLTVDIDNGKLWVA